MKEGYLALKEPVTEPTRLKTDMIDWSKTSCWGEGGYYSRVFFNVAGREPEGIIPAGEYDAFRKEVIDKLEAIEDEEGNCIGTKAFKPEEIYKEAKGIPPDLVVYLGNLDWRSAGSVGLDAIHIYENDTGPDDANHAENGIIIWDIEPGRLKEIKETYSIYDIAPTLMTYFGLDVPADMIGESLI
jgi:predicted AlkP superfamily phosphohydrolase/phosphomutase